MLTEVQTHTLSPQQTAGLYQLASSVIPTQVWLLGGQAPAGAPGLTAFRQHALFHLLQLLVAVPEFSQRLEHPLAGPHALPTGHAAVTPLRPRRQQAWDGV